MLGIGLVLILAVISGGLAIVSMVKQPLLPILLCVAVLLLSIAEGVAHYGAH